MNDTVSPIVSIAADSLSSVSNSFAKARQDTPETPVPTPTAVPVVPGFLAQGFINTIAGTNPQSGGPPSGQAATEAVLQLPYGVVVDPSGNLYISDQTTLVIYKVNAASGGDITIFAGGGSDQTNTNGVSPTSVLLSLPAGLAVDSSGDIYFADSGQNVIREVKTTGLIYTIAGNPSAPAGYSGDTGPATSASLSGPSGIAIDSANNLYIADANNNVIREVNAQGIITTVAGNSNLCSDPTSPCGDGGQASAAQLNFPNGVGVDSSGNLYIADSGDSRIRRVDSLTEEITTAAGTGAACSPPSCGDGSSAINASLNFPFDVKVDGTGNLFIADFSDGVVREANANTGNISTIAGTLGSFGFSGDGGLATSSLTAGPVALALDTYGNLYLADQANFVIRGVTGAGSVPLTPQTITFNQSFPNVTYGAQPINLTGSSDSGLPITYTVSGCTACATVSTSGSNSILTITGATAAGTSVTVTATQPGNSQFAAAKSVSSQSFTVAPASFTITAAPNGFSQSFGQPLSTQIPFTVSGLIGSDAITTPTLTVTGYTTTTPIGTSLPITITPGSFTFVAPALASNYNTPTLVPGTLTVSGNESQTISFPALPSNIMYGSKPVPLSAISSAGLPVTYTVTGSAQLIGSVGTGYMLNIIGAGPGTVTANAVGNAQFAQAAPAIQSFNVARGTITVTTANVSQPFGTPVAASQLLSGVTITGLVGSDITTGTPAITTTYTPTSAVGTTYPITVSQGTLSLSPASSVNNYSFVFVPAVLTVANSTQTVNFPPIAFGTYGGTVTLGATASSGLPVTYTVTGPATLTSISTLLFTGVGEVTVTATQAGDANHASATAKQSFSSMPAVLTITPNPVITGAGQPIPPFTYTIMGFVAGDSNNASVLSGVPVITTPATAASSPGTYPIVAGLGIPCTSVACQNTPCSTVLSPATPCTGGLLSTNYTFAFVNGTLTISGAPGLIATATPTTVTVESGHIGQTKIGFTVLNNYQGTVAFSCGQLPVNITCTFSPATVTLTPTNNGSAGLVSTTLTLNTSATSPVASMLRPTGKSAILSASILFFPAGLTGLFLAYRRKRLTSSVWGKHLFVLMILMAGAAGLTACGGGSMTGNAPAGTTPVIVTATGTGANGSPNVSSAVTLTLNVTQ